MRKLLACALLAALLCGCAQESPGEHPEDTTGQTLAAVEPTEPPGTREADNALTRETGGAVTVYTTGLEDAYALAAMGEELVIFSGTENTTLTRLTGENRYINASYTLNGYISPDMPSVLVNEKGISFRDGEALVILGTGMKEIARVTMPQELVGEPVCASDRRKIYYCTADSLWELTVETGIHRKIKEISDTFATTGALLQEGGVVECLLESGKQLFLSTETGLTLWQGDSPVDVTGYAERWYARVEEGQLTLCVYGTGEEKRMLLPRDNRSDGWYLPQNGYFITASDLCCYDLTAGTMLSRLELKDMPLDVAEDASGCIWLLCAGGRVYRWDPAALPSGDDSVYTSPRYTLDNPDPEGFAALAEDARAVEEAYHLTVLFGKEAVAVRYPEDTLTGEFLVPILREELEKLTLWLSPIPGEMLKQAVEDTTGGGLYLSLVRQIQGENGAAGAAQHWQGDDAYVALAAGQEDPTVLYHQLYHVLEVRLLSESNACYEWDSLNPRGFDYDYSYLENQNRQGEQWLGENRYFIDIFSMSFPKEDRAQLFAYAMGAENGDYFASEAMQKKLLTLCKGLREAYGLTKSPETFPWEQHLNTSLAYTK